MCVRDGASPLERVVAVDTGSAIIRGSLGGAPRPKAPTHHRDQALDGRVAGENSGQRLPARQQGHRQQGADAGRQAQHARYDVGRGLPVALAQVACHQGLRACRSVIE